MNQQIASLRRRQLDRLLTKTEVVKGLTPPTHGWIAEVRNLIGMRAAQVAARLRISTAAVLQFERSEAEGSINLSSLEKVAGALGCRLVYAFIPEASSFEEMVQARAELVARRMVDGVSHTMALEDQSLAPEQQQELIEELTQDLLRRLPRSLWDEPA